MRIDNKRAKSLVLLVEEQRVVERVVWQTYDQSSGEIFFIKRHNRMHVVYPVHGKNNKIEYATNGVIYENGKFKIYE